VQRQAEDLILKDFGMMPTAGELCLTSGFGRRIGMFQMHNLMLQHRATVSGKHCGSSGEHASIGSWAEASRWMLLQPCLLQSLVCCKEKGLHNNFSPDIY